MSAAFHLGPLAIASPAVQAALSGYSDLPMRLVARAHGAPYALHEVVLDEAVLQHGKLRRRILSVPDADHPVGGQIMGSQPERFGEAARAMMEAGFDVIDINFGCPVAKVLGRRRGGWLLQAPETALAMVDAVLNAVGGKVPVTVKMRRGSDDSDCAEANFFTILDGAMSRGVAAITLHPRTVEQKYVGASRWEFLARVKRHVGNFTLLGSGDLFSPFRVAEMLATTGVNGVTIARGCIGNPFIFGQVQDLLAGKAPVRPLAEQQRDALLQHWELAIPYYGDAERALPHVRMHAIKYGQYHRDPIWARDALVQIRVPQDLPRVVAEVFSARFDEGQSRVLDSVQTLEH